MPNMRQTILEHEQRRQKKILQTMQRTILKRQPQNPQGNQRSLKKHWKKIKRGRTPK